MIVFAGFVPHPPLIIPEIGKDDAIRVSKTREAYEKLATELAAAEPDTIILITPHMIHYPELFNVCGMPDLYGSFSNYGANLEWHGFNNVLLAEEIVDKCEDEKLPTILYDNSEGEYELDHGAMVPIHFFKEKFDFPVKILPVSYSLGTRAEHYSFGQMISEVVKNSDERVAIIASGDLSHRLIGQDSDLGQKFDEEFIAAIKTGDEYALINMDEELVERSGECGYRSALVLLGALSGSDYKPEIYSYEGPFGVGYLVADMKVKG